MEKEKIKFLKSELAKAELAALHLETSLSRIEGLKISRVESDVNDLERAEALCSRFERLSDLLLHKLLRTIDEIDQDDSLTVRKLLLTSEKKYLIHSALDYQHVKSLRNTLVHDYAGDKLLQIVNGVKKLSPILFRDLELIKKYIQTHYYES